MGGSAPGLWGRGCIHGDGGPWPAKRTPLGRRTPKMESRPHIHGRELVLRSGLVSEDGRAESLVAEAVDTAASFLKTGEQPQPILITDSWGDRRTEHFAETGLLGAKEKFGAFTGGATGDQICALVYIGHVGLDEDTIVVELGLPGEGDARMFVQRFRPRKGPLRGFQLRGELRAISPTKSPAEP